VGPHPGVQVVRGCICEHYHGATRGAIWGACGSTLSGVVVPPPPPTPLSTTVTVEHSGAHRGERVFAERRGGGVTHSIAKALLHTVQHYEKIRLAVSVPLDLFHFGLCCGSPPVLIVPGSSVIRIIQLGRDRCSVWGSQQLECQPKDLHGMVQYRVDETVVSTGPRG
jgi:hypothetical protein